MYFVQSYKTSIETQYDIHSRVDVTAWIIVYCKKDEKRAQEFSQAYIRCSGPLGLQVGQPTPMPLPDDRIDTYLRAIKSGIKPNTQLVVIIATTPHDDRYAAVKKLCCVDLPIASQVRCIRFSDALPL